MSKIDYQALREKAEKATCGVWWLEYGESRFDCDDALIHRDVVGYLPICRIEGAHPESGFDEDFQIEQQANAEFIAAASPATVLALLDELERKQQYIKRRDQENEDIALTVGKLRVELEAAEKRNAKLQSENAYIRNRYKELDLLIGKNILVMQAAIIEWQSTGDAKSGLAWIYNTLFGPGELPDESEKDAQAYFNRKYAPIDEKLMELHKWFWEQSEAERLLVFASKESDMSTITKERIELFIKSPLENGLTRGEQMELARIALASLEAEPVSQTYKLHELSGNSPVTPDGWISCSERMPNDAQWCVVDAADGYYVQCWSEGQGWLGDDISIPECDVINWMPLPEPPQEVN